VTELRKRLEGIKVPTNGKKEDLVARLALVLLGFPVPGYPPFEKPKNSIMDFLILKEGKEISCSKISGKLLSPAKVVELSTMLEKFTEDQLKEFYNPKKMNSEGVGAPRLFSQTDDKVNEGTWKYLMYHFNGIKEFLKEAVQQGCGVVAHLA